MTRNSRERTARRRTRYQHCGLIIEQGLFGWYVCDWDYEGDGPTLYIAKSRGHAERWIEERSL